MIKLDDAFKLLKDVKINPKTDEISIRNSLGLVLAEPVKAIIDSPPFDKAAMDGYAIIASDISEKFEIIETIGAGDTPTKKVEVGKCAKIMTGAMLPEGADKIVRVEYTEEENNLMKIVTPEPYENIIFKGENSKKGDIILDKCKIRPQEIAILASQGIPTIKISRPPLVGIINTGSELKNPGEKLDKGQIYNSNGFQLIGQVTKENWLSKYYGIFSDNKDELEKVFALALKECDIVLLSGGVSMGEYDFVPKIVKSNGVEIVFHKVEIKPGKPTLFGKKGDKYVFGMPGNPVSTFVIFDVFVKPFIYHWMGLDYQQTLLKGILSKKIKRRNTDRTEYRPVKYNNGIISPLSYHGSSHIDSLSEANALIRIDKGETTLEEGKEYYVRQI